MNKRVQSLLKIYKDIFFAIYPLIFSFNTHLFVCERKKHYFQELPNIQSNLEIIIQFVDVLSINKLEHKLIHANYKQLQKDQS